MTDPINNDDHYAIDADNMGEVAASVAWFVCGGCNKLHIVLLDSDGDGVCNFSLTAEELKEMTTHLRDGKPLQ